MARHRYAGGTRSHPARAPRHDVRAASGTAAVVMIEPQPLPPFALLTRYAADGGYADCFATELPGDFSHAEFVAAFYTTWLFKLERLVLATLVFKPSTDRQAEQLARGERNAFAAWTVEARSPDQLLVRDYQGKTCSWLMV